MEKRRPHYDLKTIKGAIGSFETLSIRKTALQSAFALGFDVNDIVAVIVSVERTMFFKSMTTFSDHRQWQDVYHVPAGDLVLYVKFQHDQLTEFAVVSFKER